MSFRWLLSRLLDVLLPPLCLGCDAAVGDAATLCPACWGQITFIAPPVCAACGAPFNLPVGDGMLCGACVVTRPVYNVARAAMLYDEASRGLILGFKHGDRTHAGRALAAWMQRAGGDLLQGADALVPVPLHRWRLFSRRYNQSALLATFIAQGVGIALWPDILRRVRATPSQGHRKRKERQDNVCGAFELAAGTDVGGKKIVLIDDVLTTGATVHECARVLLKAGAAEVNVLTLARVKSNA